MLGHHRTAYDFLNQIVEGCQKPISKTALYYKVGTQWDILKRHINMALHLRLIEKLGDKYRTTQKGSDFLVVWKKLQTFLSAEVREVK